MIKYSVPGNTSIGDYFARTAVLSYTPGYWTIMHTVQKLKVAVTAEFGETHVLNTLHNGTMQCMQKRFRLRGEADIASQQYDIEYILTAEIIQQSRSGINVNING